MGSHKLPREITRKAGKSHARAAPVENPYRQPQAPPGDADAKLWFRSAAFGGRRQAAGVPDFDLRVQIGGRGARFLRLHVRPQGAAERHGFRSGLFALQPSQLRDRRGPAGDLRGDGRLHPVFVRHVGDRDDIARLCPPGRRHLAFAAALRWHRDAFDTHAFRIRHRRRRLRGRRRRDGGARGCRSCRRQGPGLGHPDRDAVKSDQQPGRYRADAEDCRRGRPQPRVDADHRLRQHAARPGVPAAHRTWRRCFRLLADQICRRPFRPDRGCRHGQQGGHQADQGAARCHRHATRPAFLLDARPFAGNTVDPHGARQRQCAHGRRIPARSCQG